MTLPMLSKLFDEEETGLVEKYLKDEVKFLVGKELICKEFISDSFKDGGAITLKKPAHVVVLPVYTHGIIDEDYTPSSCLAFNGLEVKFVDPLASDLWKHLNGVNTLMMDSAVYELSRDFISLRCDIKFASYSDRLEFRKFRRERGQKFILKSRHDAIVDASSRSKLANLGDLA